MSAHYSAPERHLRRRLAFLLIAAILAIAAATFCGITLVNILTRPAPAAEPAPADEPVESELEPEPEEPATPPVIDFQPVIDEWAKTIGRATAGIYIYDLDNDQVVGQLNPDKTISTASLYKLFIVYEGYRRIATGEIDPTAKVYGSYTWAKCLDLAIRESHSGCAESMHAKMGGHITTLSSTPAKIGAIMKQFYDHPDLSADTWETIKDSMLNQPPVNNGMCGGPCDWRRGLPKGFTTGQALVYNKVGWESNRSAGYWNLYHDAAIVEFPALGRHYIVVIMTQKSQLPIVVDFGAKIEQYILSQN